MMTKVSESKAKAKRHAPPHAWKKGQSGNPGGRRPKSEELKRIEDLARTYSVEAMEALVEEAKTGKGPSRVTAAVAILDRGWGRPVERSETGEPGDFERMSLSDIQQAIAETERAIARATGGTSIGAKAAPATHPAKQD